jgi:hypothetical protein
MTRLGIVTAMLALAFCLPAAAQGVLPDEPNTLPQLDAPHRAPAARSAPRYFIDFRARSALSYGHTFAVFGRVGEKLTAKNVAGLHPKGDSTFTYLFGHLIPVDSETGMSDGDLDEQYTTARYRIWLTAAEYHRLVRHIRELQASSMAWHIPTFNCNAFAGIIAHFVGLTTPPTWLLPDDFINSMRRMNDGRQRAAGPLAGHAAMARQVATRR